MQGNGVRIAITLALLVLCGFYLYPTAQNYYYSRQLDELEGEAKQEYRNEHQQAIQEARANSLKLGLDLLGGMSVTLEVQVAQFLSELAEDTDAAFEEALQTARQRAQGGGDQSLINLFVEAFEQQNPDARLARYFRSPSAGIDRRSSNEDVAEYLRTQADQAVGRAVDIVRRRVNQYGVSEPSIQRQGSQRISVEMPGIENAQRIRELLRGTARLEFRLMGDPQQLAGAMEQIVSYYEGYQGPGADTLRRSEAPAQLPSAAGDTTGAPADTASAGQGTRLGGQSAPPPGQSPPQRQQQGGTRLNQQQQPQQPGAPDTEAGTSLQGGEGSASGPTNPLTARMRVMPRGPSVRVGQVAASDTAAVRAMLSKPEVQRMLPSGVELLYGSSPAGQNPQGEEIFTLYGARANAEMMGEVVDESSVAFTQNTNEPYASITMNSEGARTWSRLTAANVNKRVAIVLDNAVVSAPNITERIPGGRTRITGVSRTEAEDLVTVLNAGALPAPVEIVEERTVGPSLGQQSIQAGLTSVLVGLLIVALFMIFYYRTAGVVADLALFLNLVIILGILAGFNATLTLPGIAGIVLTIGMAVDANVLIFDRIREEQNAGKTLVASIDAGYSRALSAILDANVTTFFVGAILYSFGVGPVRGFAVTLMAGILSSMFTAIIVTHVVFDYMVKERSMEVSYG